MNSTTTAPTAPTGTRPDQHILSYNPQLPCGATSFIPCGGVSFMPCGGTSFIPCGATSSMPYVDISFIPCGSASFMPCVRPQYFELCPTSVP